MRETGDELQPAVQNYLDGQALSSREISLMRRYLMQWINAPVWDGPRIPMLRDLAERIQTEGDINRWLNLAEGEGIDPL